MDINLVTIDVRSDDALENFTFQFVSYKLRPARTHKEGKMPDDLSLEFNLWHINFSSIYSNSDSRSVPKTKKVLFKYITAIRCQKDSGHLQWFLTTCIYTNFYSPLKKKTLLLISTNSDWKQQSNYHLLVSSMYILSLNSIYIHR